MRGEIAGLGLTYASDGGFGWGWSAPVCFCCLLARSDCYLTACSHMMCRACADTLLSLTRSACLVCGISTAWEDLGSLPTGAGSRVLSLDGGGVKVLAQIAVLNQIEV